MLRQYNVGEKAWKLEILAVLSPKSTSALDGDSTSASSTGLLVV
jgi:hypothetical protein